ncbi:MAG: sel1 repeat family protein [Lentisphaeria bacterium]|nr:sel1 repeat family protein [Lentisphaeria bacterium]
MAISRKIFSAFLVLIFVSLTLSAADTYPDLMDQAEKLIEKKYTKGSRAYKIKAAQLDKIFESKQPETEKSQQLKNMIAELQKTATLTKPAPGKPDLKAEREAAFQAGQTLLKSGKYQQAAESFRKALEKGYEKGRDALIRLYIAHPEITNSAQRAEAIQWIKEKLKNGDVSLLHQLALLYAPDQPKMYLKTLQEAAKEKNIAAMEELGKLYFNGTGQIKRSYAMAYSYLKQAAERGSLEAMEYLAVLYRDGKGTIMDQKKAFELYQQLYRAKREGIAAVLGTFYFEGRGTAKDYTKAALMLLQGLKEKQSSISGEYDLNGLLGRIYHTGGFGQSKDPVLAEFYLQKTLRDPDALYYYGMLLLNGSNGIIPDPAKAFTVFEKAVANGSQKAKIQIGKMYISGKGVKQDHALAVLYLKNAAESGDLESGRLLAELYIAGKTPLKNDAAAFRYFRRLADKNDVAALLRCGQMTLEGRGVDKNLQSAQFYLKKAAELGNSEAMYLYGTLLLEEKKNQPALEWIRKAAEKDHLPAVRQYADLILKNADGIKAAPEFVFVLLKKLSDKGDLPATEKLASLTEKGFGTVKGNPPEAEKYYLLAAGKGSIPALAKLAEYSLARKDHKKAAEYAQIAAGNGNYEASLLLGKMYYEGTGIDKDLDAALHFLRLPADKGNKYALEKAGIILFSRNQYAAAEKYLSKLTEFTDPVSAYILGWIYYTGKDGVKQNYAQALAMLTQAAEKQHLQSMLLVASMYQRGEGITQDYQAAYNWYQKAVTLGSADAMCCIGIMYYNGAGVSPDYQTAMSWFKKAAEKNHIVAMQYIAIMYKDGIGVMKNEQEARKWRKKIMGVR